MMHIAYRDYLVSMMSKGPWTAIFADSPEDAIGQFSMAESLGVGDVVYVGLPAPLPDVWTPDHLSREIAQSLGVESIPGLDIEGLSAEIAQEANDRVARFAAQRAADLGRVVGVKSHRVQPGMAVPTFA